MKGIITGIISIALVVLVLSFVFPDSTKALVAKIDYQRDKIEKNNTVENGVELAKSELEKKEKKYEELKGRVVDLKVRKMELEKEINEIKDKINSYEESIKVLADKYKKGVSEGKKTVMINGKEYSVDNLIHQAEIINNEIKVNLKEKLKLKNEIYNEIVESLNIVEESLKEYKVNLEKDKAKYAQIIAMKTVRDVKKEVDEVKSIIDNNKYSSNIDSIKEAIEEELIKYEAEEEFEKSDGLNSAENIVEEIKNGDIENGTDEKIKELFGLE